MALYPLPKVVQQPVRYDRRLSLPFRITGHAARAGREQGSLAASTYTSACSLVERDTKRPMRHVRRPFAAVHQDAAFPLEVHVRRPFAAVHQDAAFPLEVHVPVHLVGNLCPDDFGRPPCPAFVAYLVYSTDCTFVAYT